MEEIKTQFDALWQADQTEEKIKWDDGEEAEEKATAWSLLDLYLKQSPVPPNEMPEAVEVRLEADLSAHGLPRLIGIVDLVRAGGRIVDYKTVGQTPNPEKAVHTNEMQMTSYSVLYREATGKTRRAGRPMPAATASCTGKRPGRPRAAGTSITSSKPPSSSPSPHTPTLLPHSSAR